MAQDRYSLFRTNGKVDFVPNVKITKKDSDYFETYRRGVSSLYLISYDYYGDPNYDWLIMMANPEFGSLEYEIPDNTQLRIPYPLDVTLEDYYNQINNYRVLYSNG